MTAAVEMSAPAQSQRETPRAEIDQGLAVLKDKAREFARLAPLEKARLLRACMGELERVAPAWVADGCRAKHLPAEGAPSGEEWLAGVCVTMRNLRLLVRSLEDIAAHGKPALDSSRLRRRDDGRIEVSVFPGDGIDGALFSGVTVQQLMQPGLGVDEVRARQASFFSERDAEGGVSLILGAGNVSSIPPTDFLYKAVAEGRVGVVKVNPVNEWVGPHLEQAFKPFIDRGYLRLVYGGAEVGSHLVQHALVDDVHITGSNHTHDTIVWGPAGPERERRRAAKDPLLKKPITSELGNVSPIAIAPASYSDGELEFLARNLVSMVTNNGSFNCNAAKLIITASGWSQRMTLIEKMSRHFEQAPTRFAYYPGAEQRYHRLTTGRELRRIGAGDRGTLPWTIVLNVDSRQESEPIFSMEPFCSIVSETTLEATEAGDFLEKATRFMNTRLWGTLNAMLVVPKKLEASAEVGRALDKAIVDLEYGTVAVNQWPALVFALVNPAWGGHPSATLEDVQSGIGWVHNTLLLEGIEKSVLRAPFSMFPKPAWYYDNRKTDVIGRRLFDLERSPSWLKVPGVALAALAG